MPENSPIYQLYNSLFEQQRNRFQNTTQVKEEPIVQPNIPIPNTPMKENTTNTAPETGPSKVLTFTKSTTKPFLKEPVAIKKTMTQETIEKCVQSVFREIYNEIYNQNPDQDPDQALNVMKKLLTLCKNGDESAVKQHLRTNLGENNPVSINKGEDIYYLILKSPNNKQFINEIDLKKSLEEIQSERPANKPRS